MSTAALPADANSTATNKTSTTTSTTERDINDIFDEINAVEETAEQLAYEQGHADAARGGNTDGYHLGFHRGAELGAELGYYAGIVAVHRQHRQPPPDSKLHAALGAVEAAIALVPPTNDPEVDIFERVDRVRALFRRVCALLKISGRYPEADTLSF